MANVSYLSTPQGIIKIVELVFVMVVLGTLFGALGGWIYVPTGTAVTSIITMSGRHGPERLTRTHTLHGACD